MKSRLIIVLVTMVLFLLAGCAGEPQQVEVTRVVTEQFPVTVEVTRVVVPVEVTRIVEVVVTAELAEAPTEVPSPTPTVEPTAETAASEAPYTVQPGDSMYSIAQQAGITIALLQAANNMNDSSVLIAGQELVIPGADAEFAVIQPTAPSDGNCVVYG
jgi:LysM repeat protein